ncbi:hypothetical protein Tco_1102734 [Tanacetum coccineum]
MRGCFLVEPIGAIFNGLLITSNGFFLGKHVSYPVVALTMFEKNLGLGVNMDWLNIYLTSTGIFSFQFSSMEGLDAMLKMGRSSYARALIEVWADVDLKDNIVVAMPKLVGGGDECPKNINSDVVKNMKKPSQTPRGVPIGPKVGFRPTKQVFREVSKKNNVSTSSNKKKNAEPTIEVSNSNPFDVLNLFENDVDLGTNGGTSNVSSQKVNSSGSSFWNVESSSTSTTPIIEKIDKKERIIIDGKVILMDDEGKPLKKVDSSGDYDSEDEVASVDNDMEKFLASEKVGYGTHSLLEQWTDSYVNGDYNFNPYNDDMYEGQDIPDKIQDICNNFDIKVRGRRKT